MSCKAVIKSFCIISVHKYYVVGIKTVVIAIKCIKHRVFSLHAVRKIFSRTESPSLDAKILSSKKKKKGFNSIFKELARKL